MPLKLTRRHGSPYWYLRGTVRRVRVDESTGVSDRAAAEEICIRRGKEILERSIRGDTASRTFAEAALSYMQAGGERKHLAPILTYFGERKLETVDQGAIVACARKLKPNAAPSTINRHIFTPIVAVLHHAASLKWCPPPIVERPKQPKGRIRWIEPGEAVALYEAAAPHLKPVLLFLLSTGARVSEALYLDWRHVDLTAAQVTFVHDPTQNDLRTKSEETRSVPLHPALVAELANLKHRTGAVFRKPIKGKKAKGATLEQRTFGAPYVRRKDGGGQLSTGWASMCRRAGVADFTPHDCRHTWATWHYGKNRDLGALMELGGWKSVEMVMRYTHANVGHLRSGIDAIWGETWGPSPVSTAQDFESIQQPRKA